jgi:thioredoxin 1
VLPIIFFNYIVETPQEKSKSFNIHIFQYTNTGDTVMTATFIQDETEFDALLAAEPLMVVDCTATWCGPCKLVAPLMDQLAEDYVDRAKVFKLDVDANKPLAKRFTVKSIPAVLFFKKGELIETIVGVKPYEEFTGALERSL